MEELYRVPSGFFGGLIQGVEPYIRSCSGFHPLIGGLWGCTHRLHYSFPVCGLHMGSYEETPKRNY